RLARAGDTFARHCRLASSVMLEAAPTELESRLKTSIDFAFKTVEEARAHLSLVRSKEGQELVCERRLVDEYAGVRPLEMLAGAERALAAIQSSRHADALAGVVASVETHLYEVLENEVLLRIDKGYVSADPTSTATLENYLDRASRLKKHFQEVLFLE